MLLQLPYVKVSEVGFMWQLLCDGVALEQY